MVMLTAISVRTGGLRNTTRSSDLTLRLPWAALHWCWPLLWTTTAGVLHPLVAQHSLNSLEALAAYFADSQRVGGAGTVTVPELLFLIVWRCYAVVLIDGDFLPI